MVPEEAFMTYTHEKIVFVLPEGAGGGLALTLDVGGQIATGKFGCVGIIQGSLLLVV